MMLSRASALVALVAGAGASADNCTGATKQKALYLQYIIDPPLSSVPATDISIETIWNSTMDMRRYGSNGVFAASTIHMTDGPGGYFGSQADGDSAQGGLLFSIWDKESKGESPTTNCDGGVAPNATWCRSQHAFPLSGTCRRHCLDCGLHPGWRNTTGTQCSVPMLLRDGDSVTFRLRRVNVTAVIQNPVGLGLVYNGSVWELTAALGNGSTVLVGRMLLEETFGGVARFGAFHEHIGCTPCAAFYESEVRRGPWISAPVPRVVSSIGFQRKNVTCELYQVDLFNSSGMPAAQFATGPGTGPNRCADDL